MAKKIDNKKLPRRTREHIIASQSQNYVEKLFIDKGHTADRPSDDYGTDLLIKTFDKEGYPEPGNIELQLKATEMCRFSKDGTYISFRIEVKHYNAWKDSPMPIFLVLFDASTATAYWLYLQDYFAKKQPRKTRNICSFVCQRKMF